MANQRTVTLEWRGEEWRSRLVVALNKGLANAAAVMADQAVKNMGTEGGGVRGSANKVNPATGEHGPRLRFKKKRWISAPPGAFPGIRKRQLTNSITFASPEQLGTGLRAAFGTALKYGRYLEFGTSKMAARPWIRRSATMAAPRAEAMFIRTVKSTMRAMGLVKGL